jgi:hypothetical protein
MKFFKVITPHSQTEIDEIIMSMSQSEVEYILKETDIKILTNQYLGKF